MFFDQLKEVCREKNTLLCVGLDPRVSAEMSNDPFKAIVNQNQRIIESTLPYTACYKPNIAFYEAWGLEGLSALKKTMEMIPSNIPVILDAKRGDIGSTVEAYAESAFKYFGAGCITAAPYMGRDSIDPFLEYKDKGVFVLCRTSNPSASEFQDLKYAGRDLYLHTAKVCTAWSNRIGLVVAGNDPAALNAVRSNHSDVWMLAPGIGAQGGTIEDAIKAGADSEGLGILPNVSRAVAGADDPGLAAKNYRDAINAARQTTKTWIGLDSSQLRKKKVLQGLIDTQCFKLGEFILKSGKKSPFYIDLRRVSSSPELLNKTAKAYAELLSGLPCDRIAGIPVAALPLATAVSLETGIPLIYPRMSAKGHGTGNAVEGEYKKGEKVVLLDDLITTGKSKVEAIEILRDAGLVVSDLIVLLERGASGRRDMNAAGVNLYSYANVEELLDLCCETSIINQAEAEEFKIFARDI